MIDAFFCTWPQLVKKKQSQSYANEHGLFNFFSLDSVVNCVVLLCFKVKKTFFNF